MSNALLFYCQWIDAFLDVTLTDYQNLRRKNDVISECLFQMYFITCAIEFDMERKSISPNEMHMFTERELSLTANLVLDRLTFYIF